MPRSARGEGGGEKHIRDIRGMAAVTDIDLGFLEKEIRQRGLDKQWQRVRSSQAAPGG
jgi:hypothetical protein